MSARQGRLTRGLIGLAVTGALMAMTGCGSSTSDGTSTPKEGPNKAVLKMTYDGPESKIPTSYPDFKNTGQKFTVGLACPACQSPFLLAQVNAAKAEVERLGGKLIVTDAGGDPQKQLNQFKQMVAQGVQAIILQPLVESAMAPSFVAAEKKGIAVVSIVDPADTTKPLQDGVVTNVTLGFDQAAFQKAQYLASVLPKGAEFAAIGYGVPSAGLEYLTSRQIYWAKKFGLKFTTQVNINDITAAAGVTAGSSVLSRYPNVKAVMSFDNNPVSGFLTAARTSGKNGILVCGQNFDKLGFTIVREGNGCDLRWDAEGSGKLTADAAYMAITKQNLPLPKVVTAGGGTLVTPDNYKTLKVIG